MGVFLITPKVLILQRVLLQTKLRNRQGEKETNQRKNLAGYRAFSLFHFLFSDIFIFSLAILLLYLLAGPHWQWHRRRPNKAAAQRIGC